MEQEQILSVAQSRVVGYIRDFGSITTLQAYVDLGETRLSARIFELKAKHVDIEFEWIDVANRYGEKRCVKRYFLGG